MQAATTGEVACVEQGGKKAPMSREARTGMIAGAFAATMMLLSLVLPFVFADREMRFGLTLLQVLLWGGFAGSWIVLGGMMERSGSGFVGMPKNGRPPREHGTVAEMLVFLFGFVPSCFLYAYVAHENTGYLGFNYVNFFILASFSVYVFPLKFCVLYIVGQIGGWVLLAYFMWDVWLRIDDIFTAASGYGFSMMMFILLRRERNSRFRAETLSQSLDQANARLRRYSAQAEELAATQERNRIAREIHDTLGHSLTVVNVQIESAKALLERDPVQSREFLEKAQQMTKSGLAEVRSSVASLRTARLVDKGVAASIEGLLEELESTGIRTEFRRIGELKELDAKISAALYRIAQESLTNTRKHSQASQIEVTLDCSHPQTVRLVIADDGIGCVDTNGGFGIMGIKERTHLLKGTVQIDTSPGNGFKLTIDLPR
ncbi:sensor histidine kinase [Pelagicoccus sp. SDUM812003]|uniref:sensor histidine kinase n=1 Tax=Pelagicoccus sp. SDUM812003 TaxID=3041267 RepID=UPI00280C3F81|nr:sensor histidine kinase [Pelagicoccus sp. SDUM812003]MDQ8201964.1 sensor histidine kinase [Pelagicoccus sp. SDUM812003]